ncbi:MAG: TonB-dependent receptor, partial [Pseudomonadota bacterium]
DGGSHGAVSTHIGFEFEYEQNLILADFFDQDMFETKDLILKANYTFTESDVSADGTVTTAIISSQDPVNPAAPSTTPASGFVEDGRRLQGQSDHLINLQIGLEDVEARSRATFLVNWASERIRQTANIITGAPDVLEKPPVTLDFVYSREFERFGGEWEFGFDVRNLLADDYEAIQEFDDGTTANFDVYDLGRRFNVSLSRKF